MAERKMADALDQLYKDGVKMEVQKAKENLTTEFNSKLENKADKGSNDFAPLNSPALTGTPTAPTPAANDNSEKIATTAYVAQRIQNLINAAPAALDTLGEIATALKNNPNVVQEILNSLANKIDKTTADNTYAAKSSVPTLASSTGTSTTQGMTQKAITDAINEKTKMLTGNGTLDFTKENSSGGSIEFASRAFIIGDANGARFLFGGCDLTLENGVISTNNLTLKVGELWIGSKKVTV